MTWDQAPGLLLQSLSATAVIAGVIFTVRGVVRSSAESTGAIRQRVDGHENRLCDIEQLVAGIGADREAIRALKHDVATVTTDVRDLGRGQTAMLVQLAVIPEHLKRIEEQSKSNQEATTHSLRNMRTSIEGLARRAGMIGPADG